MLHNDQARPGAPGLLLDFPGFGLVLAWFLGFFSAWKTRMVTTSLTGLGAVLDGEAGRGAGMAGVLAG